MTEFHAIFRLSVKRAGESRTGFTRAFASEVNRIASE